MRFYLDSLSETIAGNRERYEFCIFMLYMSSFSPMFGLNLFSSQAVSHDFKREHFLLQVYKLCHTFGPVVTAEILLKCRSFHIPKTVLDPTIQMDLNYLTETDCRKYFRLSHSEIRQIIVLLQLPDVIITPVHHDLVYVMEAFCLLLRCLSYPNGGLISNLNSVNMKAHCAGYSFL
jgi:hypothetical protein